MRRIENFIFFYVIKDIYASIIAYILQMTSSGLLSSSLNAILSYKPVIQQFTNSHNIAAVIDYRSNLIIIKYSLRMFHIYQQKSTTVYLLNYSFHTLTLNLQILKKINAFKPLRKGSHSDS